LCAAGAGLLLYGHVLRTLVRDWAIDDNYSHGFLVIPLAVLFALRARPRLAVEPYRSSAWGLAIVAVSLAILMLGTVGVDLFLSRISLVGVVAGSVLFLFG